MESGEPYNLIKKAGIRVRKKKRRGLFFLLLFGLVYSRIFGQGGQRGQDALQCPAREWGVKRQNHIKEAKQCPTSWL